jgi:hypothetical protein
VQPGGQNKKVFWFAPGVPVFFRKALLC